MAAAYLAIIFATSRVAAIPMRQAPATLADVHLSLAIGLFALAGILKFHDRPNGIALSWLAELILLAVAAAYFNKLPLARILRGGAATLLLLTFFALLRINLYWHLEGRSQPFNNLGFAVSLAGLATFVIVTVLGLQIVNRSPTEFPATPYTFSSWPSLVAGAIIAFNLIALLAGNLQIELWWRYHLPYSAYGFESIRKIHPASIDFAQSAWFMLYGAALMAIGFWRRSAFLRWQALVLLTLSIGKVFLIDTSHLQEGYRVASFLGLGVLLLTVSFAYQRDWLSLRAAGKP